MASFVAEASAAKLCKQTNKTHDVTQSLVQTQSEIELKKVQARDNFASLNHSGACILFYVTAPNVPNAKLVVLDTFGALRGEVAHTK